MGLDTGRDLRPAHGAERVVPRAGGDVDGQRRQLVNVRPQVGGGLGGERVGGVVQDRIVRL
ncbi:MAG: hypothetical protein JWM93_1583 [Frankiales bacterium]|nr:hypothetical protein [Frankiales bacterium]